MAARRRLLSAEERRLWAAAVEDVSPLPGRTVEAPPPPAPPPVARAADLPAAKPRPAPPAPPRPAGPRPAPGLDRRTAERLRRGRLPVEGRLDLHGMRQAEAHDALIGFLKAAHGRGERVALVITGKGMGSDGVLRQQVPRWLEERPLRDLVLAVRPARPQHGGGGALYVLLRRRR